MEKEKVEETEKPTMIVITKVETIEVPGRETILEKIAHSPNTTDIFIDGKVVPMEVLTEVVRGVEFFRPDGTSVLIGCSGQAAEAIGIQYTVFGEMTSRLAETQRRLYKAEHRLQEESNKLKELKKKSLFKKLIWCFTGK